MATMEELSEAIEHLTTGQFVELVEDVRITAFPLDAWRGASHVDTVEGGLKHRWLVIGSGVRRRCQELAGVLVK